MYMVLKGITKYRIHDDGTIFSLLSNKFLKQETLSSGHKRVMLISDGGERIKPLVHRLVARAFIDNIKDMPFVCHIDSNPGNNCVGNLRWDNAIGNMADRKNRGLYADQRGDKNRSAKLDAWQVREIRSQKAEGRRDKEIASVFKISRATVADIFSRRSWAHIS